MFDSFFEFAHGSEVLIELFGVGIAQSLFEVLGLAFGQIKNRPLVGQISFALFAHGAIILAEKHLVELFQAAYGLYRVSIACPGQRVFVPTVGIESQGWIPCFTTDEIGGFLIHGDIRLGVAFGLVGRNAGEKKFGRVVPAA